MVWFCPIRKIVRSPDSERWMTLERAWRWRNGTSFIAGSGDDHRYRSPPSHQGPGAHRHRPDLDAQPRGLHPAETHAGLADSRLDGGLPLAAGRPGGRAAVEVHGRAGPLPAL